MLKVIKNFTFIAVMFLVTCHSMEIPKQQDIGWAASEGNLQRVIEIIEQDPRSVDKVDKFGKTPLAWAVLQQNKQNKENYPQIIMFLLNNGANIHSIDKQGLTILHNAVRGGDINILEFLLKQGAVDDINKGSSEEKGRTPLAELIRDSQYSLIHLDIEKENFKTPAELKAALPKAIEQLKEKESKKSSINYILNAVRLLREKKYGAQTNVVDSQGNTPAYYINEAQVIPEEERIALLTALGVHPVTPRTLNFSEKDLSEAINRLNTVDDFLQPLGIGQKVKMVIWTIQEAAQKDKNNATKFAIIRVAMALLAKVKEEMKEKIKDINFFKDVETNLDGIRTILRDVAIRLKNELPSKAQAIQPVPLKVAPPIQPQKSCPQKISPALMLYEIRNDSNNQISIKYTHENNKEKVEVINPHQTAKLNVPLKKGELITILKSGREQIGVIGIDLEGKINIIYQPNGREGTYNWNPFTIRVNEKDEIYINSPKP